MHQALLLAAFTSVATTQGAMKAADTRKQINERE
jgi:hypothetical protein